MAERHILVVEDDPNVQRVVADLLRKEGFAVDTAADAAAAAAALKRMRPALIVLDLNLPDQDGLDFCESVKNDPQLARVPVFMLTARGASNDVVVGLEAGAEDYLPKPFNNREFVARVKAILRRGDTLPKARVLASGPIRLDLTSHQAWVDKAEVKLTLKEFEILRAFLQNPGRALSREDLLSLAWGEGVAASPRTVDVHITHLRAKLADQGRRLSTVSQVGFRFLEEG